MYTRPHFIKQTGDLSGRTGYEWVAVLAMVAPWLLCLACFVLLNAD